MRVAWDPNPTFIRLPVYNPDASPEQRDAANQQMRDLYAGYAASLDSDYPLWYFEILAVRNPASELVDLAQERRDREGGAS